MDLKDGESTEMQGSASKPYILKNIAGVYSCSCASWRNQSKPIDKRSCKHLKKYRGEAAEIQRLGESLPALAASLDKMPKSSAAVKKDTAPPVLLAETWDGTQDVEGWWMSIKYDGVHAYWNGKQFISRLGNPFYAPEWFTKIMPKIVTDGELWGGHKQFQRTVSIVRRQDKSDLWKEIKFLVFDVPDMKSSFEDRIQAIKGIAQENKHLQVVNHEQCQSVNHLQKELARVEKLGAEGLMLRQPGSTYVSGRSSTLLKVKSFKDAEAKIIGHEPGKGRHKGRLGAFQVQLPNGKQFKIGTGLNDNDRNNPLPLGSIVKFRYQELSDTGIPRFPSYVGVHEDS